MVSKYQFQIKNLTECQKLAELLASWLTPNTFLLLEGELGVGKTTFTQLIAKNLGIKEKVTSPTFNILQRYQIKDDYYLNHFDFFRLGANDDLEVFQELTIDNLNIIEWGEKNPHFWQEKKYLLINLSRENNSETRKVVINIFFFLSPSQKKKLLRFFD